MTTFDTRGKAFEGKFAQDQETAFKVVSWSWANLPSKAFPRVSNVVMSESPRRPIGAR